MEFIFAVGYDQENHLANTVISSGFTTEPHS